ncbi:MAG: hypothetical protein ACFB9M_04095 [Myxococcota bacterium]
MTASVERRLRGVRSASITALVLGCLTIAGPALGEAEQAPEAGLGRRVAEEAGLEAWSRVQTISFEWKHTPSNTVRSYEWNVPGQTVRVNMGKEIRELDLSDPAQRDTDVYRAFINDSYWPFFPLHLVWDDGVTLSEVEADEKVPGASRALRVQYGDVGPTPGDAYILFLDDTLKDVGWTYIPGRNPDKTLSTTRSAHRTQKGVRFATVFETLDGAPFIEVTAVEIR